MYDSFREPHIQIRHFFFSLTDFLELLYGGNARLVWW